MKVKPGLPVEVEQSHLALVEGAPDVLAPVIQCFRIAEAQAADPEFVQVLVPPVEGCLDAQMKLIQPPGPGHDKTAADRGSIPSRVIRICSAFGSLKSMGKSGPRPAWGVNCRTGRATTKPKGFASDRKDMQRACFVGSGAPVPLDRRGATVPPTVPR